MTKIVLIWHGHVDGMELFRFRDRKEVPRSKRRCHEEKLLTADFARRRRPAVIYMALLSRCVEAAGIIVKKLGIEPNVMQDLCFRMKNVIRSLLGRCNGDNDILLLHHSSGQVGLLVPIDLPMCACSHLTLAPCAIGKLDFVGAAAIFDQSMKWAIFSTR